MVTPASALGASWLSSDLLADFNALCDFGGRLAGSPSEFAARDFLGGRLDELGGQRRDFSFEYTGRIPLSAEATLSNGRKLDAVALPGTPTAEHESLEVVDLGLGALRDFEVAADRIAGRAVLVSHEYPFTTGHTHRRLKYEWAKEHGASAFLIANNNPRGGPVAGGSGTMDDDDIPAVGLSHDAGEALRRHTALGDGRITLRVRSEDKTWTAQNLILDIPGQSDEWVLLCAHIDGHELAESAMDNATGLATVLEVGRRLASTVGTRRRGLRLAMFTVEEWGLEGSARYVDEMPQSERDKIKLAIALDSITGHPRLSALTGNDPGVEKFVTEVGRRQGSPIDVIRPVLSNSDHYNFQRMGMPAMRLIAGYGREESLTRYLLTPSDTREMVDPSQLKAAALTVIAMVDAALNADEI